MVTSEALRDKLARSDFFTKIATSEFGSAISTSASVIYGVHATQDKVISSNGTKTRELFNSPLHHVNNLTVNPITGSLALWSPIGLSIAQAPLVIATVRVSARKNAEIPTKFLILVKCHYPM